MVFFMILATFSFGVHAQSTKSKKDSIPKKQDNFMDLASKPFTGMFGNSLGGDPNGLTKGIGFLEFLKNTGFSEEEKAEYRKVYLAQSKDLTKAKKDSLDRVFIKRLQETQEKELKQ